MIWVPSQLDSNAMLLTHGEDSGTVGVVRFMPKSGGYMASTQAHYLGQYKTLENAQKAVEAKFTFEVKSAGKVL